MTKTAETKTTTARPFQLTAEQLAELVATHKAAGTSQAKALAEVRANGQSVSQQRFRQAWNA